jgi:putative membrane protein
MNIDILRRITYWAAMTGLALLVVGMLWGQGMNSPQGQYPQNQGQYPGQPGQYPGANQPGMPSGPQPTTTSAFNDNEFAKEAAQGGMAEVKLGQLAEEKGSSQAVKDFGKRMVEDHSAANEKLRTVASREKVSLPSEISKKDQKIYDQLSQLSGDAFDRAYAKDMVKDHQHDISAFKDEASNGENPAIKGFASETLPTLEDHLKMAREMARTNGTGNKAGGGQ